jgi:UPF0755 protein
MANTAARFSRKFKVKKIFFPFLLIALFVVTFGIWFTKASGPVGGDKTEQRFVIEKGSGASYIGTKLQSQGLIKNSLAFKIYVSVTGKAAKIYAGEYSLAPNFNLFQMVDTLTKGPSEIWVTIPEGLRREEIALRFAQAFSNPTFVAGFLITSDGQEGYLFPDTYLFPKTASGSAVAQRMRAVFDQKVDFQVSTETVILASILERETITQEERPIVAGILLKRLAAGWPLQTDATIQYAKASAECIVPTAACDWWPRPLTVDDLAINSSYNTYTNPGLPPTPISNPGLSSIKAVVNSQDSPYWYYLHDSKGVIHYAAILEEHNANVQKYLR